MTRPRKPRRTVRRAKALRRELTPPEVRLWEALRTKRGNLRFRRQHPAGPYVLDFFCARANMAVEIDGFAHDTADRPRRDERRDVWLADRRIDTLGVPASDVLRDPAAVADAILATAQERMRGFGKAPPSGADAPATSPSQVDGEDKEWDQ